MGTANLSAEGAGTPGYRVSNPDHAVVDQEQYNRASDGKTSTGPNGLVRCRATPKALAKLIDWESRDGGWVRITEARNMLSGLCPKKAEPAVSGHEVLTPR